LSISDDVCLTGIKGFDDYLGGFPRGSLIVIMGHPGAGKTTFAAKFLYEGARRFGERGLYIGFGEPERKFKKFMKDLGMNFEELEREGMIKLVTLPAIASRDTAEMLTETVVRTVNGFRPKRLVIDNLPAVVDVLGDVAGRAFLRTTLYNILTREDITAIVISDMYRGEKKLAIPSVEVVADGVIVMKAEVRGGMIVRKLIIEKMKGKRMPVVEVPFSLVKGEGVIVFAPPLTYEIPAPQFTSSIKLKCESLHRALGPIYVGSQIVICTPIGMVLPPEAVIPFLKAVVEEGIKVLMISLTNPSISMWCRIENPARKYGVDMSKLRDLIEIMSLNPAAYSVTKLMSTIIAEVESRKPDVLVLHGLEALNTLCPPREFMSFYLNIITRFRKMSLTTIYMVSSNITDEISLMVNAGDVVLAVSAPTTIRGGYSVRIDILKSYLGEPRAVFTDQLKECLGKESFR